MYLKLVDWIIIIVYLLISLSIGIYFRRKATRNTQNYFLSGRKLPWYIAGTSMVATTFAADTPLAVTELVWQNGISGNWLWWNMLFGGLLTVYFFSHLWRRAEILTDAEFVSIRYSGSSARFLRSFRAIYVGLFMNTIVIAWVNLAMIKIFEVLFPNLTFFGHNSFSVLGIELSSYMIYVAMLLIFVSIYTSLSGLMGVAITDTIQFIVAMTGSIILAIFSVNYVGGIDSIVNYFHDHKWIIDFFPNLESQKTSVEGIFRMSVVAFIAYLGVQWWASWYPGAEPGGGGYIAQRMMAAKNEKHAFLSTLWFQVAHYALRPWPWIIVALVTIMLYPNAIDKGSTYVMIATEVMPNGLLGLLLAAFFAAYMSTIASQTVWGTSYVINDFLKPMFKNKSEKHYISAAQLTTVFIILLSIIMTTQFDRISDAWRFVLVMSSGIGPVLLLRWYWWRINAWSEISAMFAPYIMYPILRYGLNLDPISADFEKCLIINVFGSTFIWVLITFLTKPSDNQQLQNFYKKVRPDGPGWRKFETFSPTQKKLFNLFLCWIISCLFLILTLYLVGNIILKTYNQSIFILLIFNWFILLILCIVLLRKISFN